MFQIDEEIAALICAARFDLVGLVFAEPSRVETVNPQEKRQEHDSPQHGYAVVFQNLPHPQL